jgi:hypothetical protein
VKAASYEGVRSHHLAIDEAPGAYQKIDKRIDGYTKILIKFGEKEKAA